MKMIMAKAIERSLMARVIVLAFAAFVFNTTEFIPVALLSDIATAFSVSLSDAGLMITVYAWIVTIMSLPFMLLTAKMERRGLLMKLFILFIVCHILTIFSWNYWVLLISRAGVAFSHALFWSITASLAVRIAPRRRKMQALGLLAMGSSLAMVLGLPIGRLIGQYLGWRATFIIITIAASVAMILLWKMLPLLPSKNAGSLKSVPQLFKRPLLVGIFGLTALIITGHFTAYTYIEPFVQNVGKLSGNAANIILLLFGVAGLIGSMLFNMFHKKNPDLYLKLSVATVLLSLLALLPLSHSVITINILVVFWGIGMMGVGLGLQMRVLKLAPEATDVAMAIYSSIVNVGIGGGALLSAILIQVIGLPYIGFLGASLVAPAFIIMFWLSKRHGTPEGLTQ